MWASIVPRSRPGGRLSNMEVEAMSAHDRHHCKECKKALVEGRAYELGGYRWHVDCFVCSVCSRRLNGDTNMLVLGNGTLVCNNCSYYCNICHTKIERLAILTNDQAFCSNCFICRNCKKPIEDLKYARTPHGIFCMACHNIFMARKIQRQSRRSSANSAHRHKQLPTLPGMPRDLTSPHTGQTSRTSSSGTVPQLGSPLTGTPGTSGTAESTPAHDTSIPVQLVEESYSDASCSPERRTQARKHTHEHEHAHDTHEHTHEHEMEHTHEHEEHTHEYSHDEHSHSHSHVHAQSHRSPLSLEPVSSNRSIGSARSSIQSFSMRRNDSTRKNEARDSTRDSLRDSTRDSLRDSLRSETSLARESLREARDSIRDSIQDKESAQPKEPQAKESRESTRDSTDFHSARTSIEQVRELRDGLASPMGEQETPIKSGTSKFDKDLQKALFSSPPPMLLELRNQDPETGASPIARTGSPPPRKSHLGLMQTPHRDLNIPPRSPARSPSRPASPVSIASSMSLQRSPELLSRGDASELRSPGSTTLSEINGLDLSVPKRSNLRGTSPSARTTLAQGGANGSSTTSAPGPLPTSPRWNRASEGINSITAQSRQHKRSFSDNQAVVGDSENVLRSLVVAQHRIRTLEHKLNAQDDDALLERKSTIANLEARKTIAREELAALKSAKQESTQDEQLSQFGSKLESIKSKLEEDIASLVAQKERLKLEVSDLSEARDRAIEESSLLNTKNSQLTDLNNELSKETLEKFASQHSQQQHNSPSKLWDKRKTKRKEVGSGTRAPSGQQVPPQSVSSSGSGASGPSPYVRSSNNGPGFQDNGVATANTSSQSQQSQQFVTVLNPQEQVGGDKKNKLWPWKRMQRGTPRAVEIEDLNSYPAVVTHLSSNGGVHTGMGATKSNSSTLLGESLISRVEADGTEVPILVTRCIEEVEKRGLELEGIYRKSGSKSQIDALMEHFETHSPETAGTLDVDISAVTSALKQYLRYLKDPVITYQAYNDFVRAGRTQNITLLKSVVASLPAAHNQTLAVLVSHLAQVKGHGDKNLMNTVNLATVFAPTLTRDITGDREMEDMKARNDATQLLIDNYDSIFG